MMHGPSGWFDRCWLLTGQPRLGRPSLRIPAWHGERSREVKRPQNLPSRELFHPGDEQGDLAPQQRRGGRFEKSRTGSDCVLIAHDCFEEWPGLSHPCRKEGLQGCHCCSIVLPIWSQGKSALFHRGDDLPGFHPRMIGILELISTVVR